ncbi:D-alanyl-D-alanine carboxypeptidase, partial [Kitasatospora sp. NPDC093558]|uniref:D-alanyl-D-alanine carboxypeptidase/D-alanyl-D-alanine-endopeptidase n=1 Tax=Kitasatospora sp. NPDC093558 TaxID=3155201 RepID=UPI003430EC69
SLVAVAGAALTCPPAAANDDDNGPPIEAIMHKPGYEHAQWGVFETDPSNGQVIHNRFGNQFFQLGSITKVITESTAWHTLGPDFRFHTPLMATGTRAGSTLNGNLDLVAQGDETMGGRTKPDGTVDFTNIDHASANELPGATLTPEDPLAGMDQIAQQVHDAGITQVNGDVIIDSRIFKAPDLDPQPHPLMINDNLIDMVTTPTAPGQAAQLTWRPQISTYNVTSSVTTGPPGSATNITASPSADGTHITLCGTIAADAKPVLKISTIKDPDSFGRTAMIEALQRAGVTVTADPTTPNPTSALPLNYDGDPQVAAFVSPPYREYAKLILKVSLNVGANMALCNIATSHGSTDCFDAFPIEHDFLANVAHVDPTQFQLSDGRGVNTDVGTPIGIDQLFAYWLHTPDADAFRLALPILGVDGSNGISCTTNCPAKGKVFSKSGTVLDADFLNPGPNGQPSLGVGAQTEAGYLITDDGCIHLFYVGVTGASSPDINSFFSIFDDVNQISALLQEQASAHSPRK